MSLIKSSTLSLTERIAEVRAAVFAARQRGDRIGCVPTMGALHEGHLSLIRQARAECDFVVVTIFVNPTQFGDREDFAAYPRELLSDLDVCRDVEVDLVFNPANETIYPASSATIVDVEDLSTVLEGKYRPGHFRGVATVVVKLLNIVQPDIAYFGQKDFQQQLLIRHLCRDLCVPAEIRTCPTVREPDGLALSSRNVFLTADERESALALFGALSLARDLLTAGESDIDVVRQRMRTRLEESPGVQVDYTTIADPATLAEASKPLSEMVALVAARVGATRLIDNLLISVPSADDSSADDRSS